MGQRSKSGRQAITIFELGSQRTQRVYAAWPAIEAEPKDSFDDDALDEDRLAGWMSADEIIDELMLKLDDEEFWQLPPASVRH